MTIEIYDSSVDALSAILWEYNDSPNIQALIGARQTWLDENHIKFWDEWVNEIFNMTNCNAFGVHVWGHILDVKLYDTFDPSDTSFPAVGFEKGLNFNNGAFASDNESSSRLTLEQQRTLLKLKFFKMITRASALEINGFMNDLFENSTVYVVDNLDMTMTYKFTEYADPILIKAIFELDLWPRPAGVQITYESATLRSIGFAPSDFNFNNGNFIGNP